MIDADILALLAKLTETDGELLRWSKIRRKVPGTLERKGEALVRLWHAHLLDFMKIEGLNYISLPDGLDAGGIVEYRRSPRRFRVLYR